MMDPIQARVRGAAGAIQRRLRGAGLDGSQGRPGIPHPARGTVHIHVDPDSGDMTTHPTVIHAPAGRSVKFSHAGKGPFTIHFSGRSPFVGGKQSFHSTGSDLVSPKLRPQASGHRFHYSVSAQVGDGKHKGKIATGGHGVIAVSGG